MSKPDGGPAFPCIDAYPRYKVDEESKKLILLDSGMSLRDWFAGMAMQGVLSNEKGVTTIKSIAPRGDGKSLRSTLAVVAYDTADAMLEERSK